MILYHVTLILATLTGVMSFSKLLPALKPLVILLGYTSLHEWVVHSHIVTKTYPMYWLYAGVSVALYLDFMRKSIPSKKVKIALTSISILFLLVGCAGGYKMPELFPSLFIISGIPVLVVGCLMIFYSFLQNVSNAPITKNATFVASAIILIYQSVSFTTLGSMSFVMENENWDQFILSAHKFSSTLYYGVLGYSFLLSRWSFNKSKLA